jgi:uncharacterized protein YqeY
MSLMDKITSDLKAAMLAKQTDDVSTLRLLVSASRNKEISLRAGNDVALSDQDILAVIGSEIKKRKDSAEAYRQGGRFDLAEKESAEIKILERYMPEQMTDVDLEKIIKEAIVGLDKTAQKDFGKIMSAVMPVTAGKADGKRVSAIVKKAIS